MKNILSFFAVVFLPATAFADPGHIIASGGHDHWVAGIARGAAIAVAALGWLKGREDGTDETEETLEGEEAEA